MDPNARRRRPHRSQPRSPRPPRPDSLGGGPGHCSPPADAVRAESSLSRGRVYERNRDHEHHPRHNTMLAATLALVALIGVAIVPARVLAATPSPNRAIRPSSLAPSLPHDATRVGRLPAAQSVTIAVVLEPSHA